VYDLVVIGGGTAGLVSAAGAASMGARTALIERDRLGGECLHYGCVPTKALIRSAKVAHTLRRAEEFGMKPVEAEVDFPAVMRRMRRVIGEVGRHDSPERFRALGVELFLEQQASFEAPDEISVDGRSLRARSVILATGSHPAVPPVTGLREAGYITHVEALELERLPESLIIIGAGPIGCEFAQIFTRFGCRVSLLEVLPNPLPREDPEISVTLRDRLEAEDVSFHGGRRVIEVRRTGSEKAVISENDRRERLELRAEEILLATGQLPAVEGLNPENAGIELQRTGVRVDANLRTTAPGVYAAGDVTGKYLFTHVAEYQGRLALRNALFPLGSRADYRVVPRVTFTDPEVARVGLTEPEARRQHDKVKVFRYPFADLDRAIADGEPEGFVKLVADRRGRILGGHIIGAGAGNLIQEITLAMHRNIPVGQLSQTIHAYPTLSEGVKRAADIYYRELLFTGRNRRIFETFFKLRRLLNRYGPGRRG
jgi:pyruvate/2-oxoglutarate dehydrogenase complex dihydrolipoamide dehydrogenase (E3) component